MINCIVVDDTPLAIEKLEGFIKQVPILHLAATFGNGLDALYYLHAHRIDLVFLDIQMEQFTGLQFIEALQYRPKIVIVSAYSKYAIDGYNHNVSDYLLKPYSFERFLKAVDKVLSEKQQNTIKDYMFVKTEYRMERVDFADILFIEGQGAYLLIVTTKSKVMTLLSFAQILELLPKDNFIRVHKSYIVALDKIENIERNVIKIGKACIPVGKSYQEDFYKKI